MSLTLLYLQGDIVLSITLKRGFAARLCRERLHDIRRGRRNWMYQHWADSVARQSNATHTPHDRCRSLPPAIK